MVLGGLFLLGQQLEVLTAGTHKATDATLSVQHQQGVHRLVHEAAVVAYHHQTAAVAFQKGFQDGEGKDVKVVGGLVQHQKVGVSHQESHQIQPLQLAAGQVCHCRVLDSSLKAELLQQAGGGKGLAVVQGDDLGGLLDVFQHRRNMAAFLGHLQLGILLVVAEDCVDPSFDGAPVWLQAAGEQVQQGGLARAVAAEDTQPFPLAEDVGEVRDDWSRISCGVGPGLAHPVQLQNGASQSAASHLKGKSLVCGEFLPIDHAVDGINPGPGLCPPGLGAPQEPFPLCPQHGLNAALRVCLDFSLRLLLLQILGVVASVELDSAAGQLVDGGADIVQKVAVVGDHQHGPLGGSQVFLQPGDGGDVQLVGGLVQQQETRVVNEHLGQGNLFHHAAGKASHEG